MKRRSSIALLTTSYPIKGDGSEAAGAFVADLVNELSNHVNICVVAPGFNKSTEKVNDSIQIYRYKSANQPLSTLKMWRPDHQYQIYRVILSGQRALDDAVQQHPVCHIFALWALPSGHWARQTSKKTNIPYSVWTLGSDIWTLGRIPALKTYLSRVLRDARYCYSDGYQLQADTEVIAQRPVEFLPSTRQMNARRRTALRKQPPYRLLFIGRWHLNKGIDVLLDALLRLADEDWHRIDRVMICGGGPLEQLVKEQVAILRSRQRPIDLKGFIDQAVVEQAFIDSDYLLIPSRVESIPVVFSDAMKMDCPVVVTPVGDFPRILKNEPHCGIMSDSTQPQKYARAISESLKRSPEEFRVGMSVIKKQFDLDSIAEKLVQRCAA